MSLMLYVAALLLFLIGAAHSYLGERFLISRLLSRDNLPHLFGSDDFTKRTLRFAWHITTLAWWGFSLILLYFAVGDFSPITVLVVIAVTFLAHFVLAFLGSQGRHFSWMVFLVIGLLVLGSLGVM